jgi:uncharacterized protein YjeT (DUF2065 family)
MVLSLIFYILGILVILEGLFVALFPKKTKKIVLSLIKTEKATKKLGIIELVIGIILLIVGLLI